MNRDCDLCDNVQQEVFSYEDGRKIRVGWLCVECWPKDGSFHKAILRERVVKETPPLLKG